MPTKKSASSAKTTSKGESKASGASAGPSSRAKSAKPTIEETPKKTAEKAPAPAPGPKSPAPSAKKAAPATKSATASSAARMAASAKSDDKEPSRSQKTAKTAAAATQPASPKATEKPEKKAPASKTPVAVSAAVESKPSPKPVERQMKAEADITPTAPTEAREHYFHEHRAPAFVSPGELPQEYGDTKIVLMVRDPEWIYCYWEVNDATRQEFKIPRSGHNRRMIIRMYEITGRDWPSESARYYFDMDVSPYANNWYLRVPEANSRWCAELGVYDESGNYFSIVRSNIVATPRDRMSDEWDSEWMAVEETFRKLYGLSGGGQMLRDLRGSEALLRSLEKQVYSVLRGEGITSGALGSARVTPPVERKKDFWLQVHTELILYGATEPDAQVKVQGRPVKLRPDGTFALRFALPDGEQTLDVSACDKDGDFARSVTPVVSRHTR